MLQSQYLHPSNGGSFSIGIHNSSGNQKKMRIKYKIEFPPGSMGLELEPVIKSTEREIGCRVKDFYFSIDHTGVDQAYLESRVSIGDIICSINGEDIRSLPFLSIVEKLKKFKDTRRVITFKNITASWITKGSSIGAIDEPSLPVSPAPIVQKKSFPFQPMQHSHASQSVTVNSNIENENDPSQSLQKKTFAHKFDTFATNVGFSSPSKGNSVSGLSRKGLSLVTPQQLNQSHSQSHSLSILNKATKTSSHTNTLLSAVPNYLPLYEPEAAIHPEVSEISSSFISEAEGMEKKIEEISVSAANHFETFPVSPIRHAREETNHHYHHATQTGSIRELVGTLSTALEKQTTEVFSDLIPVYSEREMQEILSQKKSLLSELSQCLLMLGQTEERTKQIEEQLQQSEDFHRRYLELEARHELLQTSFDTQAVKIQKYEAENVILRREKKTAEEMIEELSKELRECREVNLSSLQQIDRFQERVEALERERLQEQTTYKQSVAKMCEEQQQVRQELTEAFEQAEARISSAEEERDRLKDQQLSLDLENQRFKENNQQLLSQMKEVLMQRDQQVSALNEQIVELSRQLSDQAKNQQLLQEERDLASQNYQESKLRLLVLEKESSQFSERLEESEARYQSLLQLRRSLETSLQEKSILFEDLQQQHQLLRDKQHFSDLSLQAQIQEMLDLKQEREALSRSLQRGEERRSHLTKAVSLCSASLRLFRDELAQLRETVSLETRDVAQDLSSAKRELALALGDRETQVLTLQRSLSQAESLCKETSEESAIKDERLSSLEKEVKELEQSLNDQQRQLQTSLLEKQQLQRQLDREKKELAVENTQALQQLHQDNHRLQSIVEEKTAELSSVLVSLQNTKELRARESQERVSLQIQYDQALQQSQEQEKLLKEYQNKLNQLKEQEKRLTERVSLLLQQLQDKETSLAQTKRLQSDLEQRTQKLQTKLSETLKQLEERDQSELSHQAQLQQRQYHCLELQECIDHLTEDKLSQTHELSCLKHVVSELGHRLLPSQLSQLRNQSKELKIETERLRDLHSHIVQSYREKLDFLDKRLQQVSASSSNSGQTEQRLEKEKKEAIALLVKEKEELREKLFSLEKTLFQTEQTCLRLSNLSEEKDEKHRLAVEQSDLRLSETQLELALRQEEVQQLQQQIRRQETEARQWKQQLQRLSEAETEAMKSRESDEQSLVSLSAQLHQIIQEKKALERSWQEKTESLTLLHLKERQSLSEDWEQRLQEKQRHYALELSNRDQMIEEMQLLQRETLSELEGLQKELQRQSQSLSLQQHQRVLSLQQSQRRLREEVSESLGVFSSQMMQETRSALLGLLRQQTQVSQQRERSLEKDYEAVLSEMRSNLQLFAQNFAHLNQRNETVVEEKALLAEELEQTRALHLLSLAETEGLKERLEQRQSQIQSLRETVASLEKVLALAATREEETKTTLQRLSEESLRRERERLRLRQELSEKKQELEIFHQSLQQLLLSQSSSSPPSTTTANTARARASLRQKGDEQGEDNKENRAVFSELSLPLLSPDPVSVLGSKQEEEGEFIVEETVLEVFQDQLLFASLAIHEQLAAILSQLSEEKGEEVLEEELLALSRRQVELHSLLCRPPWRSSSGGDSEVLLSPILRKKKKTPSSSAIDTNNTAINSNNTEDGNGNTSHAVTGSGDNNNPNYSYSYSNKNSYSNAGTAAIPPVNSHHCSPPPTTTNDTASTNSSSQSSASPHNAIIITSDSNNNSLMNRMDAESESESESARTIFPQTQTRTNQGEKQEEEEENEAAMSLESTDELIRRIDSFLCSVKTLEPPAAGHTKSRKTGPFDSSSSSISSRWTASALQSFDRVRLSPEEDRGSSTTTLALAPEIKSPGTEGQPLNLDESMTSDFWNLSTDEEPSLLFIEEENLI